MQELNLSGAYIRNAVNKGWEWEHIAEVILVYHGYIYKVASLKSADRYIHYHHQLCKECQSVVSIKLFGEVKKFEIDTEWSDKDIEHKFDTFMKRVIRNAVINFLKKVGNVNKAEALYEPEEFDDLSESSLIESVYLDTYDIDKFYFRLFNGGIIEVGNTMLGLALTALKELKRRVFLTSVIFEMPDENVSHLFSLSVNKVQHHKKSAKEFLKRKIEEYHEQTEGSMNNQKSSCFAYKGGKCCALEEMICEKQSCPFFKTDKQYISELKKSMEALAKLPTEQQRDISDQYYGGKMPWHNDKVFAMRSRRGDSEV